MALELIYKYRNFNYIMLRLLFFFQLNFIDSELENCNNVRNITSFERIVQLYLCANLFFIISKFVSVKICLLQQNYFFHVSRIIF